MAKSRERAATCSRDADQVVPQFPYIHPSEQMALGFKRDEHTAKVCLQVLKVAMADVAGDW